MAKQTDPQFKLRLPTGLKDRIEAEAIKNNRSMNAEIVARLEDAPISALAEAVVLGLLNALQPTATKEVKASAEDAAILFLSGAPEAKIRSFQILDMMEKTPGTKPIYTGDAVAAALKPVIEYMERNGYEIKKPSRGRSTRS